MKGCLILLAILAVFFIGHYFDHYILGLSQQGKIGVLPEPPFYENSLNINLQYEAEVKISNDTNCDNELNILTIIQNNQDTNWFDLCQEDADFTNFQINDLPPTAAGENK